MKWLSGIGKISKPKIKEKNKDEFNMNVTEIRRPADMAVSYTHLWVGKI